MALLTGKLPPDLLRELLEGAAAGAPEVRLGPAPGEDACVLALGEGVLVAATDPVTLTAAGVGAHAVHVNANDVAVTGVRPRWFLATVLLPEGTSEDAVRALVAGARAALDALGAVLVGGHTEVTPAVRQPVVVGQMLGWSPDGRFVPTGGLRPGHAVLQVGPAPVEGAALLADAPGAEALDAALRERARAALDAPGISVVEAALAATRLGASALHDPTEGGLATGLHELADASGVALVLDAEAVLWLDAGRRLCEALGADPWGMLASGTLLAGFAPERSEAARAALAADGFAVARIARAEAGRGVRQRDGAPLPRFDRDELARLLAGGAAGPAAD